jgi:predicted MFS family arabinose efflux permease
MFLSSTAAIALTVVLGLQVYDITKSRLDLGWLGLAEFLPSAFLVLISGSIADRLDRRLIVAGAGIMEVVVVALLGVYSHARHVTVLPVYVGVVFFGIARAISSPAMRSLIPASAARPLDIPRVVGISSAGWQIGAIIGPLLGAFAYKASPSLAYAFVTVLYMLSVGGVLLIPERVGRLHLDGDNLDKPTFRHAIEGLVVIRRSPILLGAISLDLFAVLLGGAVALLPAIADERHWDKGSVGLLRAAGGIGGAAVTVLLAARPLTTNVGRSLLISVSIFGVATIAFGSAHSVIVAAIAIFVLNAGDSVSVFVRSTLVPIVTPPEQQGRVLAVESVFVGASNELGAFESGVTASLLGTVPAIIVGGAATIAVVAIWWVVFPALRNVDRFHDALRRP